MNFLQKTKGSVSIFLVIILVPIIVVCSFFVDASRIELAKALTSSAGDLTLNTILTQYDTQLNENYGLLASSQSIDEFLVNAEDFFVACMVSQGVESTEAKKYAGEISQMLEGEGQIADVMRIDRTQTGAAATPLEGGNLANAALVKNEVVEFMKYRSPINNISEFIDKMSTVEKDVKDKPMEAELTNKKNKYYESENELLQKALEVYLLLVEYDEMNMTEAYIKEIETYLGTCENSYRILHERHIKNWNNTGGDLGQNIFPSVSGLVSISPESTSSFTTPNSADESALKGAITRVQTMTEKYESAKNTLQGLLNNAPIKVTYEKGNYDIQYWIQTAEVVSHGNAYLTFTKAAQDLFRTYVNLQQTYDCRITYREESEEITINTPKVVNGKPVVGTDGKAVMEEKTEIKVTRIDIPLDPGVQADYNSAIGKLSGIKSEFAGLPIQGISTKLEEISTAAKTNKTTERPQANKEVSAVAAKLNEYYNQLGIASAKMEEIMKELPKLTELAKIYGEKFTEWETYANSGKAQSPENGMVESDLKEITDIKDSLVKEGLKGTGENERMDRFINEKDVTIMANRCNAINALFGSFLAGIDKYQYNQTPIRLILDYKGLESAFPLEKSRITISNQELENYKQETWSQPLFTKPAAGEIHKVREANHPEFMKKPPELYTWLVEVKFKNYEEANYKDGKKQFDDLKEQMDAEEAKNDKEVEDYAKRNSTEEIKGKQDLPSKGTASSSKTGCCGQAFL